VSDVLTAPEVAALAAAVPDARVRALVRSHERLREMFAEAAVRIARQSELLGERAEGD
jgi:hypothetical protein